MLPIRQALHIQFFEMSMDKSKQTILITGCSSGIGYHAAHQLHKEGWRVCATARKAEDVARLKSQGLTAYQLDVTDYDSMGQCIETLVQDGQPIYGLVNNGAYAQAGAVEDLSVAALKEQFETNFFGWHHLTNLVLPHMRQNNHGRIIHISSILGFLGLKYRGAYVASKFALEGLTDCMRLELRDSQIKISLIQPGPITSKIRENSIPYFRKYIHPENSAHKLDYEKQIARLNKKGRASKYTLGPEYVTDKIRHALISPKPKARYKVTKPTHVMGVMKRLVSTKMLDNIVKNEG